MNRTPTISVVIPAYNHGRCILETLDSVFAQTYTDYEVIVVNDGSPDDTAEVLRPLAEGGRIHYFEQPNGGQASARNFGLQQAQGEFIAYLDDDDLWPPDKLEWQINILQKTNAVLVGGAAASFTVGEPSYAQWAPETETLDIDQLAERNPFLSPGQTLIRHSALKQVGGFDTTVWGADDFDLYLRLAKCGELRSDRRVGLHYRIHAENASRDRGRMLLNCHQVVRRHFPDLGSAVSRKAYRWLYSYAGRELSLGAKRAFLKMNIRSTFENLRNLWIFAPAALRDIVLTRDILADLLPGCFSRWLYASPSSTAVGRAS
jgi:glycosyltransferase involved in cell wall biosynthesis